MAYIDPEGMFGGDRMAMLSDGAKLAWPWFWCASNSVGRVELNYREFANGAFRQFRKPPSEKQFWEWVTEFHEAHLLFAYQNNGQAWGQWDISERYLPKYKTKSDERTPAPRADVFLAWQKEYRNRKVSTLSSKCHIFNISENFQKVLENSESFPHGVGSGSGSGEDLKPSSAADAAAVPADSPARIGSPVCEPVLFPSEPETVKVTDRQIQDRHDAWYHGAYWNRKDREASRRAFAKRVRLLIKSGLPFDEACAFLWREAVADRERFYSTADWEWRQNLHPATWLTGQRWEDQPKAREPPTGNQHRTKQQEHADAWDRA